MVEYQLIRRAASETPSRGDARPDTHLGYQQGGFGPVEPPCLCPLPSASRDYCQLNPSESDVTMQRGMFPFYRQMLLGKVRSKDRAFSPSSKCSVWAGNANSRGEGLRLLLCSAGIKPTEPKPESNPLKPTNVDPEPPEPAKKIKIRLADRKERTIQSMMATSYWSPDGKPISANQMIERLFGQLPRFFKDEDELRRLWSKPETRKALLQRPKRVLVRSSFPKLAG
jgi:hypothetical protein